MKVLSVTSELFPLIKTGGLADVAGALPRALTAENIDTVSLLPGYPAVLAGLAEATQVFEWPELFGGPAQLVRGRAGGLPLLVLEAPHLYDRFGNPYLAPDGKDWPDNARRFAALGRAAADVVQGAGDFIPDIVHLHDWQAGLAGPYIRQHGGAQQAIVFTVHNLAFQGVFPAAEFGSLGLAPYHFGIDGIEYHGAISFLKAGLAYADRITTVSPTYADEIRTPEHGMGMDGLLRARGAAVGGILNGIDTDVWDPEVDTLIAARFTRAKPTRRGINKAALQQRFGMTVDHTRLLSVIISRLSWQKGVDVVLEALPALRAYGMQFVLLGAGEPALESAFRAAAEANRGQMACVFGYDEALAHLMQAGADALLMPSRFEPCGLTQLCALHYGCVPVVSRNGGLADTVIDANAAAVAQGVASGVQFASVSRTGLEQALRRVAELWQDQGAWRKLQRNGMAMDVSWAKPAGQYAALFRSLRPGVA